MKKVSDAEEKGLKDFLVIDGKIYANIDAIDSYIKSLAWKVMTELLRRIEVEGEKE